MVKNLPAMPETWTQSLGQEDPLEKVMATMDRRAWWATVHAFAELDMTECPTNTHYDLRRC